MWSCVCVCGISYIKWFCYIIASELEIIKDSLFNPIKCTKFLKKKRGLSPIHSCSHSSPGWSRMRTWEVNIYWVMICPFLVFMIWDPLVGLTGKSFKVELGFITSFEHSRYASEWPDSLSWDSTFFVFPGLPHPLSHLSVLI